MAEPGTDSPRADLDRLLGGRVVLVTGKGGVGKTTVAAALARLARARGRRVLAGEYGRDTTAPSALLEALDGRREPLGPEPTALEPGLDVVRVTPEAGHRGFLREVLPLPFLTDRALRAEPVRRFLAAAPGFAELGGLYRVLQLLRQTERGAPTWDLVVLDTPASGHTLAFATLPEVMLRIMPNGPVGRALKEGLQVLRDPARTGALVTTLPETLPVSEALELVAGLARSKVHVHGVVANQVPDDPFSPQEHDALQHWLGEAARGGREVLGSRALGRLRRARAALERLRSTAGRGLWLVHEQMERGPRLVEAVAAELSRAVAPAAP